MLDFSDIATQIGRLFLAAALGGIIGLERESHGRFAGLRTNIMVALGACLLMEISLYMADLFPGLANDSVVRLDPGRIASYAIAGMGFIGGGAIIKGRGSIMGLTTAASLWLVTGVGLAIGAGYYFPPIAATGVAVAVLYRFRWLKIPGESSQVLLVVFRTDEGRLDLIREIIDGHVGARIQFVNYMSDIEAGVNTYRIQLRTKKHVRFDNIIADLTGLPGLIRIGWEKGEVP